MQKIIKECCVNSYQQAKQAYLNGADRVELCDNLYEGGTTPSYGTIKQTLQLSNQLDKSLVVMIRPRGGNFIYDEDEFNIIMYDIQMCKDLGVSEIISGILDDNSKIDNDKMNKIVSLAKPMKVSFHMAFDQISDYELGFNQLIKLGIVRVLTRGGEQYKSAIEGQNVIKNWIEQYDNQIEILPGGGVTYENYLYLCTNTKATQVHGTRIVKMQNK